MARIAPAVLRQAAAKLYKLGGQTKGGKSVGEGFGAAVGAGINFLPTPKNSPKGPVGDNDTSMADRRDVEFIKGMDPNSPEHPDEYYQEQYFVNRMNNGTPQDPFAVAAANQKAHEVGSMENENPYKSAIQQQKTSEAAAMAPIAGQWSPEGWEQNKKNTAVQAHDVNMSKKLMGAGVMMRRPTGMGGSRPPEDL